MVPRSRSAVADQRWQTCGPYWARLVGLPDRQLFLCGTEEGIGPARLLWIDSAGATLLGLAPETAETLGRRTV